MLAMSKKFELLSFFLLLALIHRRCSVGEFLGVGQFGKKEKDGEAGSAA